VTDEHDDEGFTGPAHLATADADFPVHAVLAARFDPVLGRVTWFGRVEGVPVPLTTGASVLVRTPHGEGTAKVTDQDLWGHWHLRSESTPPFGVEILDATEAR
jgi:hypothetical protein